MQLIAKPFVFMRHGETAYNQQQIMGGITDTPLNSRGRQQATAAAKLLQRRWSLIATSDLQRTKETAQLALPDQALSEFAQLAERNWGDLEGSPVNPEIVYEQTPPNGECWESLQARVIGAMNAILAQYPSPLIIAHSGVYRVLCQSINGTPYGPRIANASPYLFRPVANSNWEITLYKGQIDEQ